MKKYLLYLFSVLLISNFTFSQTDIYTIENYRYAKFNKTWYTVTKDNERGDRVDTNHVVVRLKNDGFLTDLNFSKIGLPWLKDVRGRFAGSFYELEIPKNVSPFVVTKKLSDSGWFDVVHLNLYGEIASVYPNDPYYIAGSHWNLVKIKMPEAWEKSTGSSTIKVAIIDNGVEYNHPDLIKNRWSGIGYDFYDMDSDPKPDNIENEKNCHGTCAAGIICANLNNSLGVSGIAGGWGTQKGVTFMSLRAGINDEMDFAAAADAIDYAVEKDVRVISCSWNSSSYSQTPGNPGAPELTTAINTAVGNHSTVIVFSSGNIIYDGNKFKYIRYPANLYYTIAAGASTYYDRRKEKTIGNPLDWGSCFGSELDVVAPGVNIPTTDITGQYGKNTTDYCTFNGTSSAAPHVAALAALILSIKSDLSWIEVRDIIRNNADKVGGYQYTNGFNEEMGFGRINIKRALNSILTIYISGPTRLDPGDVGTFTANPSGGSGTYTNYQWWYRNDEEIIEPFTANNVIPLAPPPGTWIYLSQYTGDQTITYGPSFDFSLKCKVTDSNGNSAEDIHSVVVAYLPKDIGKKIETVSVSQIPEQITLFGNYPNPFNPVTTIDFGLPACRSVKLVVYSINGQLVKTLLNNRLSAGYHQVQWDGKDDSGRQLTTGVYIYELKTGSERIIKKMLFVK